MQWDMKGRLIWSLTPYSPAITISLMTKKKVFLLIFLFLAFLTGIRLCWIVLTAPAIQSTAQQGIIDLRHWEVEQHQSVSLNGEWEFYPHRFLYTNNRADEAPFKPYKGVPIQVPGNWSAQISNEIDSTFGYGSYRLRLLMPTSKQQFYSIRVPSVSSSSAVYVNGRLVGHAGQPATRSNDYIARNVPYTVTFTTDQRELEIVIQAANYDDRLTGGLFGSVKLGSEQAIRKVEWLSIGSQLAVCLILLLHALYTVLMFAIGIRHKALLSFGLLNLFAIMVVLIDDDRLLLHGLSLSFEWMHKLYYLSFLGVALSLLHYVHHLLPASFLYLRRKWLRGYMMVCAAFVLCIILQPFPMSIVVDYIHTIIVLFPYLFVPVMSFRALCRGDADALFLLLGTTAVTANVIWGVVKNTVWMEMGYYPIDVIAGFIAFSLFWFKRYLRSAQQSSRLAEQLQEADKRKDDFLVNTSHELRNPLHGILTIAQTVLEQKQEQDVEANRDKLKLLLSVGRRMSFMLNDLLDITRLKESQVKLQMSTINIRSVAAGVVDMMRVMAEGKRLTFVIQIPDTFPSVTADENRIIQVLFNLLHNAVKFTDQGTITVQADIKGKLALISIADTGVGIDPSLLHTIFLPYDQGNSGEGNSAGGLGLGLSISKQLVELHKGELTVRSVVGQGTTFTFTLPLANQGVEFGGASTASVTSIPVSGPDTFKEHPIAISSAASAVKMPDYAEAAATASTASLAHHKPRTLLQSDRPRILAIDDDPVNLNILGSVLLSSQYEMWATTSVQEVLTQLETREWDLVIIDVMMPSMSGYELTATIRKRYSLTELPILLLTARSRAEDIESGFLSGANDYVTKPVDAAELRSRVYSLTSIRQSVNEQLRMEAAWLQSQIQPHFLFNTLNAIAALSEFDLERMRLMLQAFSDYLRASFDFRNSEQLISIKHELELVRSYLWIEQERYDDRLHVEWEIEDGLEFQVLPLSIQPLVENAVRHGIAKRSAGGTIWIRIKSYGLEAEISVADNGVGIASDKMSYLFDKHPNRKGGIGLINTHHRLKQLNGTGLTVKSKLGQGTTISFRMKK